MSSVVATRMRQKRNKQKRLRKQAAKKERIGCKYCEYGLCTTNSDANVAYCSKKQKIVNIVKECDDFIKRKNE